MALPKTLADIVAHLRRQPGEPSTGYISGPDAEAAFGDCQTNALHLQDQVNLLAVADHTNAEKAAADLAAATSSLTMAIGLKTNTARKIDTGSGLTGGGDLTADRTLTIAAGGILEPMLADGAVTPAKAPLLWPAAHMVWTATAGLVLRIYDTAHQRLQTVWGDTGWRDITAVLAKPTWATINYAHVRRVGSTVEMYIDFTADTPANGVNYTDPLPTGFRPPAPSGLGHNHDTAITDVNGVTTAQFLLRSTAMGLYRLPAAANGTRYRAFFTFLTSDAWPTTLPGTALGTIPTGYGT